MAGLVQLHREGATAERGWGIMDPTRPGDPPLPATLPATLLESLLAQSLESACQLDLDAKRPEAREWVAWREVLATWRQALSAPMEDADRRALAGSTVLWEQAMRSMAMPAVEDKPRRGDWHGIPDLLVDEIQAWRDAGLLEYPAASSLEIPALALLVLSRRCGMGPPDPEQRLGMAFERGAPGVCQALLDLVPGLDVDAALIAPCQKAQGLPRAHLLFGTGREAASRVLAPRVGPAARVVTDDKGRPVLGKARNDPGRARILLDMGADPDARTADGGWLDEPRGWIDENLLAYHEMLQARRAPGQAARARQAFVAMGLLTTTAATSERLGLMQEAWERPWAEVDGRKVGLLSFFLARHDGTRGASDKDVLTMLGRLLRGPSGRRVLAAEGSLEAGVGRAIALCARMRGQAWAERGTKVAAILGKALGDCDQAGVMRALVAEPSVLLFDLPRVAGPGKLLDQAHWAGAGEALDAVAERTVAALGERYAHPERQHPSPWRAALDLMEATLAARDPVPESRREKWLAAMMMMLPAVEETHPAYQRAAAWVGAGVEPAWPDPACQDKATAWLTRHHPAFLPKTRQMRLDKALPETGPESARPAMRM